MTEPNTPDKKIKVYCSFCGKESAEVRHLIGGLEGDHRAYICPYCVCTCVDVLIVKVKEKPNE